MNPTRNRLFIFLRDLVRRPYNAGGMWLLGLRLTFPDFLAAACRRLGLPGPTLASAPRIYASYGSWYRRSAPEAARFVPIYPETHVAQAAARTIAHGRRDPWRLQRYGNTRCAPAFVAGIPSGRYDGRAQDVFSGDGRLLADLSFFGPENQFRESREYARRFAGGLPSPQEWAGVSAALAVPYAALNYFHWMFQLLPRFELLRLADVSPGQVDRYLLPPIKRPFQSETLARLHIPIEKLVETGQSTHIRAEFLWTTSSLRLSGHINTWAAEFLRREFLDEGGPVEPAGGKRLYLGRGDAAGRRLVNEAEIVARLARLGFRPVSLSRLSVAEQARLLAGAEVVIAPHGAGLTNLVFARPGTTVLELHSPARRGTAYWELSNARKLDYHYLIGQDASTAADPQAFRVPVAWLDQLLEGVKVR